MSSFESMFKVDDLRSELSVRKFDANLPVELLKLDAMVVTKVDWYPSEFFRPGAPIPPPVQARRDLIRTFVTQMCDLFTKLHSADEHEDLQLLLLDAMIALVHYNCEKIVGNDIFATVAEPILLNIHGNSAAILANIFHLMFQLCSGCLRLDVYKFVMENETMLLSQLSMQLSGYLHSGLSRFVDENQTSLLASFKLMASRLERAQTTVNEEEKALCEFASFLCESVGCSLNSISEVPGIVSQVSPLLDSLLEMTPAAGKVEPLRLIARRMSKDHYDCWLLLPHLKSTIQNALDFHQWKDEEFLREEDADQSVEDAYQFEEDLDQSLIEISLCCLVRFMHHAPSQEVGLAIGNELSKGRLLMLCEKLLLFKRHLPPRYSVSILMQLVRMKALPAASIAHTNIAPALMRGILDHRQRGRAMQLFFEMVEIENLDAVEYLISCGYLSVVARCLKEMGSIETSFALAFIEDAIHADDEVFSKDIDFLVGDEEAPSLDLVMPCQFPFMLFLKEQHHEVIDGLKHVVETYPAGTEEQLHERAQDVLEDIGDIV